jgi:hypothetical protein
VICRYRADYLRRSVSAVGDVPNATRELASRASTMGTPAERRSQMTGDERDPEARTDASRVGAGSRHGLRPLSPEESATYRRWIRGTSILYGAVLVVLGGLLFAGSVPPLEKRAADPRLASGSR